MSKKSVKTILHTLYLAAVQDPEPLSMLVEASALNYKVFNESSIACLASVLLWQWLLFVPMHLVGSGCVSDAPLGASSLVEELFRELASKDTINSLQIMMKISQFKQIK